MNLPRNLTISTALLLVPACAIAQSPRGADTLSSRAIADSQAVIRELDAVLRSKPHDAAAWYRRGMIGWALAIRAQAKPPMSGLDITRIRRLADTSLRIAVGLQPKNAGYQFSIGTFLRSAPDPLSRYGAIEYFDRAAELSRTGPDSLLHSTAVVEAGRARWLRYDTQSHQVLDCTVPPSIDSARVMGSPSNVEVPTSYAASEIAFKRLHNALLECMPANSETGASDYSRAEDYFREAYATAPSNARAFRQLAMLLADRDRWRELESVARDRTNRQSDDGWGWLTLALALHRAGRSGLATAVFDSGGARLDARERGRLFAFQRLLGRADSARFATGTADVREAWERSFWGMAAPLWSRTGNDPRTEFSARVVFAEVRWTVEELGVRGADSDRGEAYIRYGPPDRIAGLRGCSWSYTPPPNFSGGPCNRMKGDALQAMIPAPSDVVTYWDYDNGLTLAFWGAPTYGTARFPVVDESHFERAIELRPAAFDNMVRDKLLELPLVIARFRAPRDSVDLLMLSKVSAAEIRNATGNATVSVQTWLFGRNGAGDFHDSTGLSASGIERGTYRVAPEQYLYRVEATAPGTMVAGRATRWITAGPDTSTGFSTRGFGLSDLLLATIAQPNKPTPVRWRDFNIVPLIGSLPKQGNLDIIWENYDLGTRVGQTQYSVAITLQRQRSASGRIAAAILGVVAGAVGVDRRDDRLTLTFDRAGPSAPGAFADHILMAMRDTPSGDYRLILEVTDKVSGRKATSASSFTIRE